MARLRALALLIPYLVLLFYLTLFFDTVHRLGPAERLNLVPFKTIEYFVREAIWWSGRPGPNAYWNISRGMVVNVGGNFAAFLPLGFLLPLLSDRKISAWHALGAGAALSTLIEALQFLSGRRVADVDDVLLNALGALLGYGCLIVLRRCWGPELSGTKDRPDWS